LGGLFIAGIQRGAFEEQIGKRFHGARVMDIHE
jgi:hypothetical protein